MTTELTDVEAVRRVLSEESCSDFVDVADRVRERFGLKIGAGRVEQILKELPPPRAGSRLPGPVHAEIGTSGSPQQNRGAETETPSPDRVRILEFVEAMGGFDRARDAITQLEHALRNLLGESNP